MRASETAFHLLIDASGLFAGFRDIAAPKSGECPLYAGGETVAGAPFT